MSKTNTAAVASDKAKADQTTTTGKGVDLSKPGDKPKADAKDSKPADTKAGTPAPAPTPAETPAEEPKVDPFANLPRISLADTQDVLDMSGLETSNPRKYAKVQEDAAANKLPLQRGWKHATAMFVPGTNKGGENGFKPGSVYGTIADIVQRAGRSGISAHELVTQVRQRQIGNKRSHYCEKLPPVGWAEGWINTAVTKNIIGVHATKRAPAIFPVAAAGTEATAAENNAAKAAEAKAA